MATTIQYRDDGMTAPVEVNVENPLPVTPIIPEGGALPPLPVRGGGSVVQATLAGSAIAAIAAAGDYAALDIISNSATNNAGVPWVIPNPARVAGGQGLITKVVVGFSADTMTARIRLRLFNAAPSLATEQDDNAAYSLALADRLRYLGAIDLPALSDHGAASVTEDAALRFPFATLPLDNTLYAIMQFIDAEANEAAGMTATLLVQTSWTN